MAEIFLDTETTGLSYKDGHKIIEIACVETSGFIPTGRVFHKILNPERNVSEDAFRIHGFSNEMLNDKPLFSEIINEFLDFIEEKKIVIHNAPFDLGFLNNELKINKSKLINKNYIIDSLEIAKIKYPGQSNSLDALCKRFSIDLSKRTKHNALLDCELLREVYINLVDAKEPKLSFASLKKEENIIFKKSHSAVLKKIVKITDKEIEDHKTFLKKEIKKNYFY